MNQASGICHCLVQALVDVRGQLASEFAIHADITADRIFDIAVGIQRLHFVVGGWNQRPHCVGVAARHGEDGIRA